MDYLEFIITSLILTPKPIIRGTRQKQKFPSLTQKIRKKTWVYYQTRLGKIYHLKFSGEEFLMEVFSAHGKQ